MQEPKKSRVLIAPDSFKGTMSATEVCRIIRKAFLQVKPALDVCCLPMADGGEGTVDAFLSALGGERKTARVHGPLFAMCDAAFGILEDGTAVIEMAAASGLPLAGKDKNPLYTSTYGTGELIRAALDHGSRIRSFDTFCACSTIPMTVGFLNAGVPFGSTMSFLIASPLLNPIIIGMLGTMVGLKAMAVYFILAFGCSVVFGYVLEKI